MTHFVGIDVSLETSSVCIVDETGLTVRELIVESEPEALAAALLATGLPRVDLQQPQHRRAALGEAQRVESRRHTLREDRLILHGRPLPRRDHRLAQALTSPSTTWAV